MDMYAVEEEFILDEDFNEVRLILQYIAEHFLSLGTPYLIWYDPDVERGYGRIKQMSLHSQHPDTPPVFPVGEHRPPVYQDMVGLYLVSSGVAQGEPPALPDGWRARMNLRAKKIRALRQQIAGQQEE